MFLFTAAVLASPGLTGDLILLRLGSSLVLAGCGAEICMQSTKEVALENERTLAIGDRSAYFFNLLYSNSGSTATVVGQVGRLLSLVSCATEHRGAIVVSLLFSILKL